MRQFTIEPEFRDKIPPLSAEEFSKLEANILEDGEVRDPIVIWGNTIIDGHNRWAIIQKHPEIPFKVKAMEFPSKWAAIAWICNNQLGRRNLTDAQKTYLIGKQYEAQKHCESFHGNQYSGCLHNEDHQSGRTKDKMSKETGISATTIERSERFSRGLDIAESVTPGIKDAVLSGLVKSPKSMIAEIRRVPEEHRKEVVEAIKAGDTAAAKKIINREPVSAVPEKQEESRPAYDVNDFKGDLMSAVKNFDFALRQHMFVVHFDLLNEEEGRTAADEVLMTAKEIIKGYFAQIDRIRKKEGDHGTED